jgi:hypothetical protein
MLMGKVSFCTCNEKNNFVLGTSTHKKAFATRVCNAALNSAQYQHTLNVFNASTCRAAEVGRVSVSDQFL